MREPDSDLFCSRRNFLKSITIGTLAINAGNVPFAFAKDAYPADKITWISPYKAGGGFDLVARGISPYLTKYLRELSPGAKGGNGGGRAKSLQQRLWRQAGRVHRRRL